MAVLLDKKEAIELVGLPYRTFTKLESAGDTPKSYSFGSKKYYEREDVISWRDAHRSTAVNA